MINCLIRLIRKLSRMFSDRSGLPAGLILILVVTLVLSACRLLPDFTTSGTSSETCVSVSSSESSSSISGTTTSVDTSSESQTGSSGSSVSTSHTSQIQTTSSSSYETSTTTSSTSSTKPTTTATQTTTAESSTTAEPTDKPTGTPTNTPTPATEDFPYKNYGTFFRDNYGDNSNIVSSPDGGISIDIGSAPYGVVLLSVSSIPTEKRCKIIVTANGKSYQYEFPERNIFKGIPMQLGEGSYTMTVYEEVSETSYTPVFAHTFDVNLASSLKPFTAASIMSDFSTSSNCVVKANSLCSGMTTATGRVDAVYRWIVGNISYDRDLAERITSGEIKIYLPDPETTYSTRKGICFDYASLMCAMLRCQGIPTRLVFGQTPLGYHAWNEVYFAGKGWVIVASFSWEYIDGSGWVMFDTTFAAGGMTPENIQATTHTKQKIY